MLSQPFTQRAVWSIYGAGTIFFINFPLTLSKTVDL
jgi:hypothetical protein